MIRQIFCIYDSKAEAYLRPFFTETKGLAVRSFEDILKDDKHPFAQHPADYTLFHLGSFDDANASFDLFDTAISIGKALEFVAMNENKK